MVDVVGPVIGTLFKLLPYMVAKVATIVPMPSSWSARGWLYLEEIPCTAEEFLKYVRRCDKTPALKLLDAGVRATTLDDERNTALILASQRCLDDDVAIVKKLLEKREVIESLSHRNFSRMTAYMAARSSDGEARDEILQLLMAANAPQERVAEMDLARAVAKEATGQVEVTLGGHPAPDVNVTDADGKTPLLVAVERNSLEIASLLIDRGADVNRAGPDGKSPLMVAAERNFEGLVKLLLQTGAEVDAATPNGSTALILAAWKGRTAVVRLLVEEGGADANVRNEDGQTALMGAMARRLPEMERILRAAGARGGEDAVTLFEAASRGDLNAVRQLLEQGCDPDVRHEHGDTPLMAASARGWTKVVECLLEERYHGSVNAKNEALETALIRAATAGHLDVLTALLRRGAQLDERNQESDTALILAAREGRGAVVELLLQQGATVDARGKDSLTALMAACHSGSLTAVWALLEHGARGDLRADLGNTPWMIAELAGHTAIVRLLAERKLTRGCREAELFLASRRGHEATVKRLVQPLVTLQHGAEHDSQLDMLKASGGAVDINARDLDRRTALTEAIENGRHRIVEMLIDAGANVDGGALLAAAKHGEVGVMRIVIDHMIKRTPPPASLASRALLEAASSGHTGVVQLLLDERLGDVNAVNRAGDTALILAAGRGHLQVVEALLQRGANPNVEGKNGNTALMAALLTGHLAIAGVLVEKGARGKAAEGNLLHAVREDNLDQVRRLLAQHPDLQARDQQGRTALMIACEEGHDSIAAALLQHTPDDDIRARVNDVDPHGNTSLMLACRGGHYLIVRRLLGHHADVDPKTDTSRTALMEAALNGSLAIVTDLISGSADVNAVDDDGNTPLREALLSGNIRVLGLLESKGAVAGGKEVRLMRAAGSANMVDLSSAIAENPDLNARGRGGRTALMLAAGSGWDKGVTALIAAGADPNARDSGERTALSTAAKDGHTAVVQALLDLGADPNARDRNEETPLMEAAAGGHLAAVKALLVGRANANAKDRHGSNALMRAVIAGRSQVVEHLTGIESLDLGAVDDRGRTATMFAHLDESASDIEGVLLAKGARKGWDEAELLRAARDGDPNRIDALGEGLDLEAVDLEGNTALLIASQRGHAAFVRRLIDAGAGIASRNGQRRTPLMEAAAVGASEVVDLLIKSGADVNARDDKARTALMEASRRGAEAVVKSLHLAGADPNLRNVVGETPLILAARSGSFPTLDALLSNGARIDDSTAGGRTALMEAAEAGHEDALGLLIRHQADLNAEDRRGETALALALAKDRAGCAHQLREAGAEEVDDVTSRVVWITDTGDHYHTRGCPYTKVSNLNNRLTPMEESQAVAQLYERCTVCKAGLGIAPLLILNFGVGV